MAERTAWRICSDNGWKSVFGKKRGKAKRPGPVAADDHVQRSHAADPANQRWLGVVGMDVADAGLK
ncbi:hypothetical protein LQL77_32265 [Rhodococcus cerastii]|nr:hypothetical protein [Rhodococcus cerastii]